MEGARFRFGPLTKAGHLGGLSRDEHGPSRRWAFLTRGYLRCWWGDRLAWRGLGQAKAGWRGSPARRC